MLIGENVYQGMQTLSSGGELNILPDILPGEYIIGYKNPATNIKYNFRDWMYCYYLNYEFIVYDMDRLNTTFYKTSFDVVEILEQQYPGCKLYNAYGS